MVFRSGILDKGQCGNLSACYQRETAPKFQPRVHQFLISPIRGHSQKPEEAREKIVELMGDLPRVELFAREKTEGWDAWGNEVESDIEISSDTEKEWR